MDKSGGPLEGIRVLLLEDEALVFLDQQDTLLNMGCEVVGGQSISEAFAAMEEGPINIGLLDVNISGNMSYPVAEELLRRGVPVVFTTGYQSVGLDGKWAGFHFCEKPCTPKDIQALIIKGLGRQPEA
jgi:DNA-binding NtrC family response regulator